MSELKFDIPKKIKQFELNLYFEVEPTIEEIADIIKNLSNDYKISILYDDNILTLRFIPSETPIKETSTKEAYWDISFDGWYPYCSNCKTEPFDYVLKNGKVPDICPECGARMTNCDKLNK